jgi:hypothetical protein
MKLVVQDRGLWCVLRLERRGPKRLPHVHDRQADFLGFYGAEPGIELIEAGFRTVHAAKPNGPAFEEIADDDAIRVPLAHRDLVDTYDGWVESWGTPELLVHVELVEFLDGVPIEPQLLGHHLHGGIVTASADKESKPLRVIRQRGQPIEPFGPDGTATPAVHTPNTQSQKDSLVAAREIANQAWTLIVEPAMLLPTLSADRFFRRRRSGRMMASASPG